jgi:SGNH hydrolase-like domain, acetyltransferase AlgX
MNTVDVNHAVQSNPFARSKRRWWLKPLVSLTVAFLMLPAMEIAVRFVAPQAPSWLDIYRRHPALPLYALQPNVSSRMETGETRWTVISDAEGFRVGRAHAVPDDRPTALWLGDSFVFGNSVDFENSFVGRLASDPRRRYRHVNAAVGGYGPTQYRETLEYLLAKGMRPAVVLVGTFLGNDFFDCLADKNLPVRDGVLVLEGGGLKNFLKRRLHLYRLASAAMHRLRPSPMSQSNLDRQMADPQAWAAGQLREGEQIYRAEFARIAALCREHGIALAVLVIPYATTVDAVRHGNGDASGHELPRRHALAAFRELGIRYLDLTPALARRPVTETYFYYDGHLTSAGHAIVAEAIGSEWKDILFAH